MKNTILILSMFATLIFTTACEIVKEDEGDDNVDDTKQYTQIEYYNSTDIPFNNLQISFLMYEILVVADDSGFATVSKYKLLPLDSLQSLLAELYRADKTCYGPNDPIPMIGHSVYIAVRQLNETLCILSGMEGVDKLEDLHADVMSTGEENLPVEATAKVQN